MVHLHPPVWYGMLWEVSYGKPLACRSLVSGNTSAWLNAPTTTLWWKKLSYCGSCFGHDAHVSDRWHADRSFRSAYRHLVLALPTHKSCQLMDSRASLTSRHFIFQVCPSLLVDHWPEPKLDASSSIVPKLRFLTDGPVWSQDEATCTPHPRWQLVLC